MEKNTANTPEKRFSAGAITATIWQNQVKAKDGEEIDFRTVSFQRRYKDKNGLWQNASSLRVNDLPRASLVLQRAYEYLVLKEALSGAPRIYNEEEIVESI